MEIKDINDSVDNIELIAFAEKVNILNASNGSQYLAVSLADKTGRIEGRKWAVEASEIQNFTSGNMYLVKAKVSTYKNIYQLKINAYQLLTDEKLQEMQIDRNDFMRKAPIDFEQTYQEVVKEINGFHNGTYKALTLSLLKKYAEEFKNYPAAINIHHNVVGGLLWHSSSLMKNVTAIEKNYAYGIIDWELAKCGAILHDIGKIYEMNGIIADDYTLKGKLLGHISIGSEMIGKMAEELKIANDDVVKLQHVVLSSHGKREFGSPQEPQLIEGVLISTFDNLDARINHISEELEKVQEGKWTQRILSEDGKMFLNHYKK
jgi:3'-5' exoribonuclease